MNIKGELIRITTKDNLELQGILFESKIKTGKAIIHVHGWTGNFYENKFIDYIAKDALSKGYAFLTFNNRGAGFVQEFIQRSNLKVRYKKIGGSIEKFEDCLIDISAAVDFMHRVGYGQIILEGHSLGCQKITFYQYKTNDKRIKGLILLAPVDDVSFTKRDLGSRYQEAIEIAKGLLEKKNVPLPEWMVFSPMLTAEVFLNMADPQSLSGRIFDYSGRLKEVREIDIPVLAVFGSRDEYEKRSVDKLKILKDKIRYCNVVLIKRADHGFVGFEKELSQQIKKWLPKINL